MDERSIARVVIFCLSCGLLAGAGLWCSEMVSELIRPDLFTGITGKLFLFLGLLFFSGLALLAILGMACAVLNKIPRGLV